MKIEAISLLSLCLCGPLLAQDLVATSSPTVALSQNSVAISSASEQSHNGFTYKKPHAFDFITKFPSDMADFPKTAFRKENMGIITAVALTTTILFLGDQRIVDNAKQIGKQLGISRTNYQQTFATIKVPGVAKGLELEGPFDSGSSLYFIGDGTIDLSLAAGFLGFGLVKSDNRALQTSSQIVEALIAGGLALQIIKRSTGRGSPFTTDVHGGTWHMFPNQLEFNRHVSSYDAFPSGHLYSTMATLTVISENYPEYTYIRPVGYTLMTLLGFQMLNNGVHWASDYPLALAMGYAFGHIAVKKGRKAKTASLEFHPVVFNSGAGIQATFRFSTGKKRES